MTNTVQPNWQDLPGAPLIAAGLDALASLAAGHLQDFTVQALLVAVGARRLRAAGLDIPVVSNWPAEPELALYGAIAAMHPQDAHSRYNAAIRRLVSFEAALEQRMRRHGMAEGSGC